MKVGILTFHRSINYGAFMQSFALASEIQKRYGDIVEIIDFEKKSKHQNYAKPLCGLRYWLIFGNEYRQMYRRFQDDLKRLPLSKPELITDDYNKVFDYINGKYDVVIVGSDAIWSYKKGLGLENPYWLFGDKLKCTKMSYAASAYGLDFKGVGDEDRRYIKQCLASFAYIGVRDGETERFVKAIGVEQPVHLNCDPTILLDRPDKEEAQRILYDRFGMTDRKKTVSVMFALNQRYLKRIMKHLGKQDFQYVSLYHHLNWYDRFNPFAPRILTDLSPYEWYLVYRCYYLNITTYFHGTALALKSNVPTIVLDNTNMGREYQSKQHQIMSDLNLEKYWFDNTSYSDEQAKKILDVVDELVENHDKISSEIEKSMQIEKCKCESFFNVLNTLLHS